ncbi:hypothetical protein [Halovivax limisalsi]|uniref:hypothetical protein n=1 Tax=Halovivax limisalsi TaxID=1453760 RepID=UPI001FFD9B10|nr:hypothetical protein [Halovivax limisalsi]
MLGTPALLGVAVGSYEAATRSSVDAEDEVTGTVCDLAFGQDHLAAEPTGLSADPRVLDELGISEGQQLRVRRTDDEYAIYTVLEERPEAPNDLVRMSGEGRCRLDLEGREFPGVEDEECPEPLDGCSLADAEFEATLSASVVDDKSATEARKNGGFVEHLADYGSNEIFLAPSGGQIEPKTHEQAHVAGEVAKVTTWRAMGWRKGGGSFTRYHVPSRLIDPASFPDLETVADRDFETAVSFNGLCDDGIEVGGDASMAFKQMLVDSIEQLMPSCSIPVRAVDKFTDEELLVNRLGDDGIFISQSWDVRRAYADEIAYGVAAAFGASVQPTLNSC